jgi:hypothetical protein
VQSSKKFRGPNKEYFKQKEYETYQEARIDMKTLPIRGHKLVYDTKKLKQHKIFYKCKKGCPIQAFIKLNK